MYYEYPLNIQNGLNYARRWAYSRNPEYYDFDTLGGDCTNFVSQCIYAEGAVMNYTKDTGWYYISLNDRAAAWTGVEYFCRFIINNKGTGPFGELVPLYNAQSGDVIQLGGDMGFYHSLYVISSMLRLIPMTPTLARLILIFLIKQGVSISSVQDVTLIAEAPALDCVHSLCKNEIFGVKQNRVGNIRRLP